MSLNTGFTHPHATTRRQIPTSANLFASSFFHLTPGLPVYLEVGWCWMSGPTMLWSHFLRSGPHLGWAMHQHTASCRAQVFQQEPKVSWTAAEVLGGFRKWSYRKVVLVQSNEASWSSWNFHASYVHALSHSHYRFLNQLGQKTTKQRLPGLPQDISLTGWLWLPEQHLKWSRLEYVFHCFLETDLREVSFYCLRNEPRNL